MKKKEEKFRAFIELETINIFLSDFSSPSVYIQLIQLHAHDTRTPADAATAADDDVKSMKSVIRFSDIWRAEIYPRSVSSQWDDDNFYWIMKNIYETIEIFLQNI